MSDLTISVILAAYNRAEFLRSTLEALVSQSRPADQVVVADNNSTDDTKNVILSFVGRLPIEYVLETKPGAAAARNAAIARATGEIIAITDDDCVPDVDWLKYIEQPFLRDPTIGMVGGRVSIYGTPAGVAERFSHADHLAYEGAD